MNKFLFLQIFFKLIFTAFNYVGKDCSQKHKFLGFSKIVLKFFPLTKSLGTTEIENQFPYQNKCDTDVIRLTITRIT